MKKNSLKIFILLIGILIVSFVASFLINNFHILKLKAEDRVIKDIDLSEIDTNGLIYSIDKMISKEENKKINLNYTGYINKLVIEYKTENNYDIVINYIGKNYYGEEVQKETIEGFNSRLDKSYTRINDDVNNITINFDNATNFEIINIKIDNSISFNLYLFLIIFLGLTVITVIFLYCKFDLFKGRFEYLFLALILLLGTIYIIVEPYTTSISWDDQIHYSTMYRLFELDGITEWTKADHDMTEVSPFIHIDTFEEKNLQNKYLNSATEIVKMESNSPLIQYEQVGYLVPGLIMKLCLIIGIPFTIKIILTKFSMLLTYSLIIFFAIKIIPRGKKIIALIGILPSNLFLATQFSYDPPITAGIILFVATFIKIMEDENVKVNLFYGLVLIAAMLIASFIKEIYIPLILLILFIPKERFLSKKQNNYFKIGTILIFILIMSTFVLPTVTETSTLGDLRGGNTSTSGQMSIIVNNPVGYLMVLNNSAGIEFTEKLIGDKTIINYAYTNALIGRTSSNYDNNIYYVLLIVLLFVVITDSYKEKEYHNEKKVKIFNMIIIFGIIIIIWSALYISFTPVGETIINGVQNRYFIPLLVPIIIISLANSKIRTTIDSKKYDTVIMLVFSIVIMFSVYSVFFYGMCG